MKAKILGVGAMLFVGITGAANANTDASIQNDTFFGIGGPPSGYAYNNQSPGIWNIIVCVTCALRIHIHGPAVHGQFAPRRNKRVSQLFFPVAFDTVNGLWRFVSPLPIYDDFRWNKYNTCRRRNFFKLIISRNYKLREHQSLDHR